VNWSVTVMNEFRPNVMSSSDQSAGDFRNDVRKWLRQEAPKYEPPADINERSPALLELARQWQIAKSQAGYAAFMWPKELGGHASAQKQIIFMQEQGRYKLPPTAFFVGTDVVIPALLYFDEKAHLERFAAPALRAEETWCELFSEPGAGSDLAGIRARAERDGNDWIINGQKVWNSFAQWADWAMIVVRTDPKVPKHKGLTMFVMDMKTPGIEVRPLRTISGQEEFNEVFLTDVRIPDANRLAGVGDGWKVFMWTLLTERIGNASDPAVGRNLIKALLKLGKKIDHAGGNKLIQSSEMRARLADYYVDVSAVGLINARMVDELVSGKVAGPESGIGKMVLSSRLQEMAAYGIDVSGVAGLVGNDAVSAELAEIHDGFLSAPGYRVGGGTDQILRNLIAEQVLGLPREDRPDKDVPFNQL
jgi:alkylation response protein AidB-like acyl-CoA dehydrogenase